MKTAGGLFEGESKAGIARVFACLGGLFSVGIGLRWRFLRWVEVGGRWVFIGCLVQFWCVFGAKKRENGAEVGRNVAFLGVRNWTPLFVCFV